MMPQHSWKKTFIKKILTQTISTTEPASSPEASQGQSDLGCKQQMPSDLRTPPRMSWHC